MNRYCKAGDRMTREKYEECIKIAVAEGYTRAVARDIIALLFDVSGDRPFDVSGDRL